MKLSLKYSFIIMVLFVILGITAISGYYINNTEYFSQELKGELAVYPKPDNMKLRYKFYFPFQNKLRTEERVITVNADRVELAVTEQFLKGPKTTYFGTPFGEGVQILDVNISNNICYVSVSEEFLNQKWLANEENMLYLYSIVNTFTEIEGVHKVQILIEGRKKDVKIGEISLNQTLARNDDYIYIKRRFPSDVVSEFIDYIIELRYDKAYGYLSKESREKYTYDEFKTAAESHFGDFKGFRRTITFSGELGGAWHVYVKYVNYDKLDPQFVTKKFDLIKMVEEDGEWKINFVK